MPQEVVSRITRFDEGLLPQRTRKTQENAAPTAVGTQGQRVHARFNVVAAQSQEPVAGAGNRDEIAHRDPLQPAVSIRNKAKAV
jgi:hypothetical protein